MNRGRRTTHRRARVAQAARWYSWRRPPSTSTRSTPRTDGNLVTGAGMGTRQLEADAPVRSARVNDGARRIRPALQRPSSTSFVEPAATEPPPQVVDLNAARVRRRSILGGLINEYAQAA